MFVADDLGAWLVGLLADAGRKKLTALLLGSDQERALRQAAAAAIQDTAEEMSPSGGEQAGQIAMVISEAFRQPMPDAPLAGVGTLLEGLQAGIAGQLAVLDDVGLTGTGRSSADVLGVPGTVLAESLTGYLVREIMLRGSHGGPLTPLADQLNHDLTHLQGKRVEGMLARLTGEFRDALARPGSGVAVAGRPLGEVNDPFALEVHRPMQLEDPLPGLPTLPAYVPREHDMKLGRVVRAAAEGRSGIAVLVGGSSTGKTRACWEALRLLRDRPGQWRLWHPIDPSRPDAALRELPGIGPRTVVWLNEAQFYLDVADGGLGERVAAGLRELLRDPARAPVLVLATLWPQFWDALTARPAGGADPHAQARDLLADQDITVPAAFTAAQLQRLSAVGDARLTQAAAGAQDGQVIQVLAGAPELLARYRNAPPAAAALIRAAMDSRRLGMQVGLPHAFLEAATPGYLTDSEWDALGEDWLEQALAYTAVPCKGVRGPLTRIRPRPDRSRATRPGSQDSEEQLAGGQASIPGMPLYRLADYLDQHGRHHRKSQSPPAGFWAAAADHAFPGDQAALGDAAHARGLYRDAAQLHKNAAARGNLHAAVYLANPPHYLRADIRPVRWAVAHVALGDSAGVASLLGRLRAAGAEEQVTALADRAVAHVAFGDPAAVAGLLSGLRAAGAAEQITALLHRDPASHVSLDAPYAVASLLGDLRAAGAEEQITALADRAVAHIALGDPAAVARLLDGLLEADAEEQITALMHRDPASHVALGDPRAVVGLLDGLRAAGAEEQITALADRAIAHVALGDPAAVAGLLGRLRAAGAAEQVTALMHRDPAAHVTLGDPAAVVGLLDGLRAAGAEEQVTALADRAVAHVALDDPYAVASLLDGLRAAGAAEQITALADRAAAHVALGDPAAVARLLDGLRAAGAAEQITALADRAAAHVALGNPYAVASLLGRLRAAGAAEQITALADRAIAHVALGDPAAVARLLDGLRAAGAAEQITALLHRDPAARVALDDPAAVVGLLDGLLEAGSEEQVTALLHRDPAAHVALGDPAAVARLLDGLRAAGAEEQVTALADRAAAHVALGDPAAVARLLDGLRAAGAEEQVTALADRAAAHVALDDPYAVAGLLGRLLEAGAAEQVTALLHRDPAAHVFLDDRYQMARLLDVLREAGAAEQVTALAERLSAAGMFELFCEQEGHLDRFRFGREADGSPAEPWGWEDLD